jgi:hypothetical protein
MRGVGSPARPLDPGEDAMWVGVTPFERVLDGNPPVKVRTRRIAARTVKRLRG